MSIFGKSQNSKIEVLQSYGDPRGNMSVRKFLRGKQRLQSKIGSYKAIISEMKGRIGNTPLIVVNTISGCSGTDDDLGD